MDQKLLKNSIKPQDLTCNYITCSTCFCTDQLVSQYINTVSASVLTGLSRRALDTLRYRGGGPRYLRIGRRIRYRIDDLHAWMQRGAVPDSDPTVACSADEAGGDHG